MSLWNRMDHCFNDPHLTEHPPTRSQPGAQGGGFPLPPLSSLVVSAKVSVRVRFATISRQTLSDSTFHRFEVPPRLALVATPSRSRDFRRLQRTG